MCMWPELKYHFTISFSSLSKVKRSFEIKWCCNQKKPQGNDNTKIVKRANYCLHMQFKRRYRKRVSGQMFVNVECGWLFILTFNKFLAKIDVSASTLKLEDDWSSLIISIRQSVYMCKLGKTNCQKLFLLYSTFLFCMHLSHLCCYSILKLSLKWKQLFISLQHVSIQQLDQSLYCATKSLLSSIIVNILSQTDLFWVIWLLTLNYLQRQSWQPRIKK